MRSDLTVRKYWFRYNIYDNDPYEEWFDCYKTCILQHSDRKNIYSIDNTCFEVHFVIMTGKIISFFSPVSQKNLNRMVNATYAKTLYKDINKKYVK